MWTVSGESQPRGISTDGRLVAVAGHKDITIVEGSSKKIILPINYEASCVSLHPEGSHVAVGSCSDNKVCSCPLSYYLAPQDKGNSES